MANINDPSIEEVNELQSGDLLYVGRGSEDKKYDGSKLAPKIKSSNKLVYNHKFVTETEAREAESNYTYAGATVTVGSGGDCSTLAEAVANVVDGGVIQFLDGTYNSSDEPSGYFMINDTTKSFKIIGNATDRTAVKWVQPSANTYGVRVRIANDITIENISIESAFDNTLININQSITAEGTRVLFRNCVIESKSLNGNLLIAMTGDPVTDGKFEFDRCKIIQSAHNSSNAFTQIDVTDAEATTYNLPVTFSKCDIYGRINVNSSIFINVYDSYITQDDDKVLFQIGNDTELPTYTEAKVDLRGNKFVMEAGAEQHLVLLSRGVNNVIMYNNYIECPESSNDLLIGIVCKSRAVTLGDVTIEGNLVITPRPMYFKGAARSIANKNTFISNHTLYGFGVEYNATEEIDNLVTVEIDVIENVFTNNVALGNLSAVQATTQIAGQTVLQILDSNTSNNNTYYVKSGDVYLYSPSTTFEKRRDVTVQDSASILALNID